MKVLKKGKAPGADDIPIELWKELRDVVIVIIWRLCTKIWKSGEWPIDWCRAVSIPLYKKGNLKECANHRTISLINHAGKILLKVITLKIRPNYKFEIAEEQGGFVEGKGAREQIVRI